MQISQMPASIMRCNLENYFSHQVSKKGQFFPNIVASEVIFPLLRDQSCIVYLFFLNSSC